MSKKPTRRDIIARFALKKGGGSSRPMLCKSNGKVAYPDGPTAERAALELQRIGTDPSEPYECKHTRTPHYHLTTID
jgi:hypothetical protein